MSLVFDGSSTARLRRLTGLIASSQNFQILVAIKRTGAQVGNQYLMSLYSSTSGHDVVVNNSGFGSTYAPVLLANYVTGAGPLDVLTLNEWWWVALGGTNGTLTIRTRKHGGTAWASATAAQATSPYLIPTQFWLASPATTQSLAMKAAQVFEYNRELTAAELTAQVAAAAPLITADLVSFKSGIAPTLAEALLGSVGATFENLGGVSLDADRPSFGPVLSGTIQLPSVASLDLVAPVIASTSAAGETATIAVGNLDPAATTLALVRAASVGGVPATTGHVTTSYAINAAEIAAGLKTVDVAGHLPGSTYFYFAYVYTDATQSAGSPWASVTFGTSAALAAAEGPDVALLTASQAASITLACFEEGDFSADSDGPVISVFGPVTVTEAGGYSISASATDLTGVASMRISRNGTVIGEFAGPGPHTVAETVAYADNGTRSYVVTAIDLAGNVSTAPKDVSIAILQGGFSVTITASAASILSPGTVVLAASVPAGSTIDRVEFLQNGAQLGQAVTQAPYVKVAQFLTAADNGTRQYQALVYLADGTIGYSNTVSVLVNIAAAAAQPLVISTGMADIIEIPRRDTTRAIMFYLENAQTGAPLTGVAPRVQIAQESAAYADPTGVVAEISLAGYYVYWPSAEDVNIDGRFSVSITADGAVPVPVIQCRVVTPYGKR